MDKSRLMLSVLVVTLSWSCMRTFAQTTTNPATTLLGDTTEPSIRAETTPNTVTETTASVTTDTTANHKSETTPTTLVANTTQPTVPPVPSNTTVSPLPENVNNTGCGTEKRCAAEPSECNPSTDPLCFFLAARLMDGNNFEFALSGQSDGYVAASVLSPTNGKEVTYVCAKSNNEVTFFGTITENNALTLTTLHVGSVKGKVNGATIQCTFLATVPDPLDLKTKIRARGETSVIIAVSIGTFDAASGSLGTPTAKIRAFIIDLAQANTTVDNTTVGNALFSSVPALLLETAVSTTDCGTQKLCFMTQPESCNPAVSGSTCSFLSVKQISGQIYSFEISGQSSGYIGSLLSADTTWGNNDSAYLCVNYYGYVIFITALYDGTQLTVSSLNVIYGSVAGRVDGNTIQCTYEALLPDINTRAADYAIAVINGTYNSFTRALGVPFFLFNTNVLNLTDVTISSPGVVPHQQPLLHVLLLSAGVLGLTILTGH